MVVGAAASLAGADQLRWVGTVAVVVGVAVAGMVLTWGHRSRPTGVARSLAALEAIRTAPRSVRQRALEVPFADRVLGPLMRAVTGTGRRITRVEQVRQITRRLDLAGNPPGWDVDRVVSLRLLLTFLAVVLGTLGCLLLTAGPLRSVLVVPAAGALGWFAPSLLLYQMAYDRSERILRELPDAVDLLTISVEAGLGFDAALSQVARNTDGPLAQELSRVLQEMQIGTGRVDALRALAARSDVADLQSFVSAMVQADMYGVPVAAVLRVQSDEARSKRSQRAEETAQRVPVKILFPLIFGIMPALFVVVIGPAAVAAFSSLRLL